MPAARRRFGCVPPGEPRLLEGARLFNAGAFFESHEAWESLWHEVEGEERELLQGLIQLAAAYHHAHQGNDTGARYLYRRGRARVARWEPAHAGMAITAFLALVDQDFAKHARARRRPAARIQIEPSR